MEAPAAKNIPNQTRLGCRVIKRKASTTPPQAAAERLALRHQTARESDAALNPVTRPATRGIKGYAKERSTVSPLIDGSLPNRTSFENQSPKNTSQSNVTINVRMARWPRDPIYVIRSYSWAGRRAGGTSPTPRPPERTAEVRDSRTAKRGGCSLQ